MTPDSVELRRPERAEVYEKDLTGIEQAVILAMLEIAGGESRQLFIRIRRIAAWSKFDKRSVQRALWGDHRTHPDQPKPKREKGKPEPECPYCKGLVQRRVLEQLAPANWKKKRPATYRLNLEILEDSEAVRRFLDQKNLFPRNRRSHDPASHGRGIQRPTVAPSGDPRSGDPASHGRIDSKAFDSRSLDPKERECESREPLSLSIDRTQEEKRGGSAAAADETQLQRVLRLRRQEH
jgi:hypothetical protein